MTINIDAAGLRRALLKVHEDSNVEVMDVDYILAEIEETDQGLVFSLETEHACASGVYDVLYTYLPGPVSTILDERADRGESMAEGSMEILVLTDEEMAEFEADGTGIEMTISLKTTRVEWFNSEYKLGLDGTTIGKTMDEIEVD